MNLKRVLVAQMADLRQSRLGKAVRNLLRPTNVLSFLKHVGFFRRLTKDDACSEVNGKRCFVRHCMLLL